jgi:hypothetical protein
MGQEKGELKSLRQVLELGSLIKGLDKMVIAKSARSIFLSVFPNHVEPIL